MDILILGGTVFLGRHLVEAAQERGHRVTLFHRGHSGADLFPEAERLIGDRNADLALLEGRRWDAVIDTCGYVPSSVRRSAEALSGAVGTYVFISSVSAYSGHPPEGIDEQGALASASEDQVREAERMAAEAGTSTVSLGALYGPMKAYCEQALEAALPGRALVIRPGLIVGPYDYSDRFTWWVRRVAEGGEVLAPGPPERRPRFIDARDLAEWTVRIAEAGETGVYNAVGPAGGWAMEEILNACKTASGSDARFTWVDEQFLLEREIGPWMQLPLWLPEDYLGFFRISDDKATAAGLTFRPLAETVGDTLDWDRATSFESTWEVGLAPDVERDLLNRWAAGSRRVRRS